MDNDGFYNEILELIESKREDDWWDFKREHHKDKADLVHDIICMANNKANRDSYIICGIEDRTFNLIGIENDSYRRNQQNIVDILRSVQFAGSVRPRIEVRTLYISDHELDVIIIKNSCDVPYYLDKQYQDKDVKSSTGVKIGKIVHPYQIYTRVVDNNTEINKNADINDIEYLWKKRFGLTDTPLQQIYKLLQNPDDWEYEDQKYYHKLYPQYTISNIMDYEKREENEPYNEEYPEMYHYMQSDSSAKYGRISIFHYSTKLFSCQSTYLDGARALIPCPEWEFISFEKSFDNDASFRYYTEDSLEWKLLYFYWKKKDETTGQEASIAIRRHMQVVLLFADNKQRDQFISFLLSNKEYYYKKIEDLQNNIIRNDIHEIDKERMIDAYSINSMFSEWRDNNSN
ncbi:MAG: ATP-binding protein [Ruminococcus sp.]|uniref:ATP-binding protein n=1 Tax=Ruminococcus sp. TaxID=41978 RepID=UPI0025E91C3B|nr:ATP-binding protein [Ruminococcus sp.]MBO4866165.1 ATP-binding protein [Ruminococcus sp.]